MPASVTADGVGRYPQDVEAAVYFSVLEALQNVAKYAGATRAGVRLAGSGHDLRFEVTDDGAGFDPDLPRPTGLACRAWRTGCTPTAAHSTCGPRPAPAPRSPGGCPVGCLGRPDDWTGTAVEAGRGGLLPA